MSNFSHSSRSILNLHTIERFHGNSLMAKIGRTVCEAECLPRKEFFEVWETAKRIRRHMRGGKILDLAAGHGLLSAILLIMDNSSPSATLVDIRKPQSYEKLMFVLMKKWPKLKGRLDYKVMPLEEISGNENTLAVSVHACGILTDKVLDLAISARCRVAVVPCCHDLKQCDLGGLANWMDGPLAVDATRLARLKSENFKVAALNIPKEITPKNHLLLGWPQ